MKHDTFTLELTFKVLFKGVEVYTHDGVFSAYAVKWQGSWTRRFYGQFVINHQGEAWDGDEDGNDEEKRVAQLLNDDEINLEYKEDFRQQTIIGW